jgi:hypothetical protein
MSSKRWNCKWIFGKSHFFKGSEPWCFLASSVVYFYHHQVFWKLGEKWKTDLEELIKTGNLTPTLFDGFTGMKLKACIHINFDITSKKLQQQIACCLFRKGIVEDKNRNLKSYSITLLVKVESFHTFERSSNFDPSLNFKAMTFEKWVSPLHRGNAEALINKCQMSHI